MMRLSDITTIKGRLGALIDSQEGEARKIEDLVMLCENTGAINTAQKLKIMLSDEEVELTSLQNMKKAFEQEEARLLSINPESRYPFVSERNSPGIGHQYRGYIVRNKGSRYGRNSLRDRRY